MGQITVILEPGRGAPLIQTLKGMAKGISRRATFIYFLSSAFLSGDIWRALL